MTVWIIMAVVWYIAGAILLLYGLARDFGRLSVADLLICLVGGIVGVILAVFEWLDSITIYRRKR